MDKLEQEINFQFHNKSLLTLALTHKSYNERSNNERLEFLGDRVLGMIIAQWLWDHYPDAVEGALARMHANLVCKEALVKVAKNLNLSHYIKVSKTEFRAGTNANKSLLADTMEALIAAVYLDGGLELTTKMLINLWTPLFAEETIEDKDYKSLLQEWAQARGLALPEYKVIKMLGAHHDPTFTIEVVVEGFGSAQAMGKNKKIASQQAAALLLDI
jgi:ribonuclease-3